MLGTVLDWIQELGTRNVFGNMPLVFLSFLLKMYVYYIHIYLVSHIHISINPFAIPFVCYLFSHM